MDKNLPEAIDRFGIGPCAALELGCGTGNNAIWLTRQGFAVTALDISEAAVEEARKKAAEAGVSVEYACEDLTKGEFACGPFGFIFDRGCFHSIGDDHDLRQGFARMVHERLSQGGYWLSLIGSADGPELEVGPPRLSASEIVTSTEPFFEIISLTATEFDSDGDHRPGAWSCLLRKRST